MRIKRVALSLISNEVLPHNLRLRRNFGLILFFLMIPFFTFRISIFCDPSNVRQLASTTSNEFMTKNAKSISYRISPSSEPSRSDPIVGVIHTMLSNQLEY